MNSKGMFYTNVSDYETKEDMMNDFIALRMYDMTKDKEIERLNNIINELEKYCKEMAHIEEKELIAMNDFEEVYIDVLDKIKELKGSDKE